MKDIEIITALLKGNHLESNELQRADKLIYLLRVELKSRYNAPEVADQC